MYWVNHNKEVSSLQKLIQLDIQDDGCGNDEVIQTFQRIIDYSVKTSHPRFFNQLYSAPDPYAVMASWLTDLLNTNE